MIPGAPEPRVLDFDRYLAAVCKPRLVHLCKVAVGNTVAVRIAGSVAIAVGWLRRLNQGASHALS